MRPASVNQTLSCSAASHLSKLGIEAVEYLIGVREATSLNIVQTFPDFFIERRSIGALAPGHADVRLRVGAYCNLLRRV